MREEEKIRPVRRASGLYTEGMGMGRREFGSNVVRATQPELADLIQSTAGKRAPEFQDFGGSRKYSRPDSPAPPRGASRGVHLLDDKGMVWNAVWSCRRREYVRSFPDVISEIDLSNIVGRCDKVASIMAGKGGGAIPRRRPIFWGR